MVLVLDLAERDLRAADQLLELHVDADVAQPQTVELTRLAELDARAGEDYRTSAVTAYRKPAPSKVATVVAGRG